MISDFPNPKGLSMTPRLLRTLLAPALLCVGAVHAADPPAGRDLLLVLDASGSMWGQIQGENKIVIARRVLADLLPRIPDGTQVGLVAYGHRREADCEDIETVVPVGPLDRAAMAQAVASIQPKGKTPITGSLREALRILRERGAPATIILVSDGLETCDADPCATVREAKEAGVEFVLHIVGFDMGDADVSALECTAQAGDGIYFDAASAEELAEALDEAVVRPADVPEGRLVVKAVADGKLHDVTVRVMDPRTGKDVVFGRTYESPETNPRTLALEPGTYRVVVRSVSLKGNVERVFEDVVIASEPVEKTVDFSSGEIVIGVTRNGELTDALVTIYESGTKNRIHGGRTYRNPTHNPAKYRVTPGTFDIVIENLEIAGKPGETFTGVELAGQGRVERKVEFASAELRVRVSQGDVLVDAVVAVTDSATGTSVDQGRTYTSETSNPKAFTLLPGTYTVTVSPVKSKDLPKKELTVTLAAGGSEERSVEY